MITTGQSVTALALLMGGFTVIQITATMLNLYGNLFFHILSEQDSGRWDLRTAR